MFNIGKLACILLLLNVSFSAIAQEKKINKTNQQWLQYYGMVKLSDKWMFLADGGYRVANNFQASSQYVIRAGADYMFTPNIWIGAGFAHLGFYSSGKISKAEFRPFEELNIRNKLYNVDINNRVRIEERFINPVVDGKVKGPGTFNFRFRYSLLASIPVFRLSKTHTDRKVLLNLGDEVFFNAGKNIVYNVFDQNRFIISPTVQFNKNFSVSFTYNSQFAATNTEATYNKTNILWLQVRQTFDAVRKNKSNNLKK